MLEESKNNSGATWKIYLNQGLQAFKVLIHQHFVVQAKSHCSYSTIQTRNKDDFHCKYYSKTLTQQLIQ